MVVAQECHEPRVPRSEDTRRKKGTKQGEGQEANKKENTQHSGGKETKGKRKEQETGDNQETRLASWLHFPIKAAVYLK